MRYISYTIQLEDGIFELRCIFGKDIKLVKKRRNDWMSRQGIDELRGD